MATILPSRRWHCSRAAVDSPIHEQIRDVSAKEAEIGHQATVDKCRGVADQMRERFAAEPADRLVGALGGRMQHHRSHNLPHRDRR